MKLPVLSREEMIKKLTPPTGKARIVIDTDTYNEVDDQFALAYALLSPEKLSVEAVYAAPFSSAFFSRLLGTDGVGIPMTSDLKLGLQQSYEEIHKVYGYLGKSSEGKVFKGSDSYLTEPGRPVESEAARDLVKRAMASEELLYVVAIGEITNIASAIMMEPEIIKKITVVWLAGQPLNWPQAVEFNLGQDVIASQFMFDCGVPLVLVPCMTVASNLTTSAAELDAAINGKSRIGTYLSEIVISQLDETAAANMLNLFRLTYMKGLDDYGPDVNEPIHSMACTRIIWDISTVGYMINPNWCPSTLVPAPHFMSDLTWKLDPDRHLMRVCNFVYRDGIFGDMFKKLSEADN